MPDPPPEPRAAAWRVHARTTLASTGLAATGLVVLVDGAFRGWLLYRLFAIGVGGLLVLPLALVLSCGARGARVVQRAGLSLATLAVLLLAVEVWARVADGGAAIGSPVSRADPVLAHAMQPGRGGFDRWGFRNRAVPERAEVVVLGDSQSYGTSIRAVDSYPSALAREAGVEVYNMALGGYGPLQYLALGERALTLEPRVLVIGFYFGNDIADAHRAARLEHWRAMRDPKLSYGAPGAPPAGSRAPNLALSAWEQLMERSRVVWSLSYFAKVRLRKTRALAGLLWKDPEGASWDAGAIHTHFVAGKRLRHLNPRRPLVRDGLRIAISALDQLTALARGRGAQVVLLAIHTKEHYYHRLYEERGLRPPADLARLYEAERWAEGEVRALADELELLWVDPTPEVLQALRDDQPLWPAYSDGHLDEAGCALFGAVLARDLRALLAR